VDAHWLDDGDAETARDQRIGLDRGEHLGTHLARYPLLLEHRICEVAHPAVAGEGDELRPFQVGRDDHLAPGKRVVAGHHADRAGVEQRVGQQIRVVELADREADIDILAQHVVAHDAGDVERDRDRRVGGREVDQGIGHQGMADGGRRDDAQLAHAQAAQVLGEALDIAEGGE